MIKIMKKAVFFLCLGLMVFALTACGSSSSSVTEGSDKDVTGQENTNEPDNPEASAESSAPDNSTNAEQTDEPEGDEGEGGNAGAGNTVDDKGTVEILKTIWDSYGEDEKFAVMGGDMSVMENGGPGAYGISDTDVLDSTLGFPAAQVENIDGAASLVHMMNANTFTCGAYHLKDKGQAEAVGEALRENIQSRQWMCGFPDELLIFTVDDCVAAAFGEKEIMDTFKEKVTESYENADILYEEMIQG